MFGEAARPGGFEADDGAVVGCCVAPDDVPALILSGEALLRSGVALRDGTTIGPRPETGHRVVIREHCDIGEDVSIWSNSIIDYGRRIGDRVKVHCNCHVAQ
jgi:UDP-3-O-[3-hydroxymyristoyl] glucosamine N-acyltransferase